MEELQKKYQWRKQELRQILEETAALRSKALLSLAKTNSLTRHLTGRQRKAAALTYNLGEIKMRINRKSPLVFQNPDGEPLHGYWQAPGDIADIRDIRELKQKGLMILALIDGIRKKLLQLDLLELRCREIMLSIEKVMEAFSHESRIILRKIYPFGIFSLFYRTLRSLFGNAYFSLCDMESIAALGNITSHVLKIADSPII